MFVMRLVARFVPGLRLIDTPHSINPRRETNGYTLINMDTLSGVRLHPRVKVVAIS